MSGAYSPHKYALLMLTDCDLQTHRDCCVSYLPLQSLPYDKAWRHHAQCQPKYAQSGNQVGRIQDARSSSSREAEDTLVFWPRTYLYAKLGHWRGQWTLCTRGARPSYRSATMHLDMREISFPFAPHCKRAFATVYDISGGSTEGHPRTDKHTVCGTGTRAPSAFHAMEGLCYRSKWQYTSLFRSYLDPKVDSGHCTSVLRAGPAILGQ